MPGPRALYTKIQYFKNNTYHRKGSLKTTKGIQFNN